jgi:TRAP-type C4-dicarboxylate transport system permease small subunit
MFDRLQRFYLTAVEWLALLAVTLIAISAALTVLDVVMRSIVGRPLFGTNDVVIMLLTAGILACFPYCTATRQHLRVTALGTRLNRSGFWMVEIVAGLAILVTLGAFAWQFASRAIMLAKTSEVSQLLLIPLAPVWWVGSVLMGIAALAQCLLILHDAAGLLTRKPVPRSESEDGDVVV